MNFRSGKRSAVWEKAGPSAAYLTLMSGHPFSMNYNFNDDYSGSGEFFDRPDIVAAPTYNRSNPAQFLDLSCFQNSVRLSSGLAATVSPIPVSPARGTLARSVAMHSYGPNYRNFDFAIAKIDYRSQNASSYSSALTFST